MGTTGLVTMDYDALLNVEHKYEKETGIFDEMDFSDSSNHPFMHSNDWLDDIFNDCVEQPILNDCMITEAVHAHPQFKSEHSYSLDCDSIVNRSRELELCSNNLTADLDTVSFFVKKIDNKVRDAEQQTVYIKQEPDEKFGIEKPLSTTLLVTDGTDGQHLSVLRQPVIPKVSIKLEPADTSFSQEIAVFELPPTPPSSSDSESGYSPKPSSYATCISKRSLFTSECPTELSASNSLTDLQSLPVSGPLILSEEEKRTLVQEGYPIPTRLPLTKTEERSLKKVRRKIKNKLSAQESRRKKKEYVDSLERRCETFSSENIALKKQVQTLEKSNKSLLSQLQRLQTMVGCISFSAKQVSTQTPATSFFVVVFCFAVFFGSLSPAGIGLDYHNFTSVQTWWQLQPASELKPSSSLSDVDNMGDAYATSNRLSRVLLSCQENELIDSQNKFSSTATYPKSDESDSINNETTPRTNNRKVAKSILTNQHLL